MVSACSAHIESEKHKNNVRFPQSCHDDWMNDFFFVAFVLFIYSIRSSHMMGSLATSLKTNTAAPKTIIWIFYAGERVSHPQGGVLRLFIYKDAWRVLINKHICCHGHLGIDHSSCSSCTCYSKRNDILPISLVLLSTSISYALTFPTHEASTIFSLRVCVCVRERETERERDWLILGEHVCARGAIMLMLLSDV